MAIGAGEDIGRTTGIGRNQGCGPGSWLTVPIAGSSTPVDFFEVSEKQGAVNRVGAIVAVHTECIEISQI